MKKILFGFIFFTSVIFPQTNTFEKVHYEFSASSSWHQDTDGNYIGVLSKNSNVFAAKLDSYGNIIWTEELQGFLTSHAEFYAFNDSVYVFIGTVTNLSSTDLKIIFFNKDGQTINSVLLDVNGEDTFIDFTCDSMNNLIVVTRSDSFYVSSLDFAGNINWQIAYSTPLIFQNCSITNDGINTYFALYGKLRKIDITGKLLWQKNTAYFAKMYYSTNHIYSITKTHIGKSDTSGVPIWSKANSNNVDFAIISENRIVTLNHEQYTQISKLTVFDGEGILQESINIMGLSNGLNSTNDSGLICSGIYNEAAWFLKTNESINYSSLLILTPLKNNNLLISDTSNIKIKSDNLSSLLTLKYSNNSGEDWNLISDHLSDSVTNIKWLVPIDLSDSCLLKISCNNNPLINSVSPNFKITPGNQYDFLSVNEIKMWIGNEGQGSFYGESGGLLWPGGEDATLNAIFADGLVFSGLVNGELKANGNLHRPGLQPGIIISTGVADDKTKGKYSIWKLKDDWQNFPPGPERERYEWIYNNWPFEIGAPYIDNDGNGIYTPGIDEPDYIGEEVLFYVVNDLDPELTRLGSTPIGLEFQVSTFGFDRQDELKNVVYKRYLILNKSDETIEDMYLSYWADPDLGDANDDCVGVDSILNLGYCYNFNEDDMVYGSPPPAVGHRIVQGPIVQGTQQDSGLFRGKWIHGIKNLNTSSIVLNTNMSPYRDPSTVVEMYNYQTGLNFNGEQFVNPHTQIATRFPLNGDPVTGIGWYWGTGWPGGVQPTDIRYLVTCGPFNMSATDTQEVVVAIVIDRGTDRLNSIEKMKNVSIAADNFYKSQFTFTSVVDNPIVYTFKLEQNYPNPFNPITKIKYQLANSGNVEIKLYSILGEEVQTLLNEFKYAGDHSLVVNLDSFAAGVYFYRLISGEYSSVKKMILLK